MSSHGNQRHGFHGGVEPDARLSFHTGEQAAEMAKAAGADVTFDPKSGKFTAVTGKGNARFPGGVQSYTQKSSTVEVLRIIGVLFAFLAIVIGAMLLGGFV